MDKGALASFADGVRSASGSSSGSGSPTGLLVLLYVACALVLAVALVVYVRRRTEAARARALPLEERQRNRLRFVVEAYRRGSVGASRLRKRLGMDRGVFENTLEYLRDSGLVRETTSSWKPEKWWPGDVRVLSLTALGTDEVDQAQHDPERPTQNLAPLVLLHWEGDLVGQKQTGGTGNTQVSGSGHTVQGGVGNIQSVRVQGLDFGSVREFVDEYRTLIRENETHARARERAEAQLAVLDAEVKAASEGHADEDDARNAGRKALAIAQTIAVSAAGHAAFAGLSEAWAHIFG